MKLTRLCLIAGLNALPACGGTLATATPPAVRIDTPTRASFASTVSRDRLHDTACALDASASIVVDGVPCDAASTSPRITVRAESGGTRRVVLESDDDARLLQQTAAELSRRIGPSETIRFTASNDLPPKEEQHHSPSRENRSHEDRAGRIVGVVLLSVMGGAAALFGLGAVVSAACSGGGCFSLRY